MNLARKKLLEYCHDSGDNDMVVMTTMMVAMATHMKVDCRKLPRIKLGTNYS